MSRSCLLCFLAVLITLIPAASQGDKAVQIFVGNEPVELEETIPAILSEDVCVPVRPFAEALGAQVDWDGSSGTLTVSGPAGAGVLRIGSHVARIKGTQVYFPYAPYLFDGRFYAPILFFSEMFDQAWYWDPYTRQFQWVPIFPRWRGGRGLAPPIPYGPARRTPKAEAPPIPTTRIVVGAAVRTLPSRINPRIVVRTAGKRITYPVARDVIILRGRIGGRAMEVPLGSIRPGDRVILRFNEESVATSIRAQYKVVSGKVQSVAKSTVLLETGETLKVIPETEIILPENIRGHLSDIRAGDVVAAGVSPITGKTYIIKALPSIEDERPPEQDQISLNTVGPLRAGDVLIVRFKAHAGGQAWFTIPGAKANIPMAEVEPGVYQGEYTVQIGDTALRQRIKLTFRAPGGETYSRLSRRPVTVRTVAGYLPRITSPRQGQQISSPVVVQGMADPGSLVRVTIQFRRNLQRLLPLEGITAMEDVRADRDGRWQTPPLAAVAPFSEKEPNLPADFGIFSDVYEFEQEPPTIYTITAISIGPNGEEQAAYSIEVTKRPGVALEGLVPPSVELKTSLGS